MFETIDLDMDDEPVPSKSKSKTKSCKVKVPRGRLTEEEKLARKEAKEVEKAIKQSLAEQKRSEKPGNAINVSDNQKDRKAFFRIYFVSETLVFRRSQC